MKVLKTQGEDEDETEFEAVTRKLQGKNDGSKACKRMPREHLISPESSC
jgi:hypothetical protein